MSISDPAQSATIELENTVVTAINAGGEALTQDGIDFLADQYFTGGATFGDVPEGNGLQPAFAGTVYQTERYGNFSYSIPVASTTQAYTIELRFGEIWWSNPGERVFDVSLEGQTVLDDLDILAQTGNFDSPYTFISRPIMASANGTLDLEFFNELDNAKLSGIIVRQVAGQTGSDGPDTMAGDVGDNVMLGGAGDDILIGVEGADFLDGGTGNDTLEGNADQDILLGAEGNDTLLGGMGADQMSGGLGDDVYGVDDAGDAILESSGEGFDTVYSDITYTLQSNVEALIFTGSADINGTGNDGGNALLGNAGRNVLTGGGGDDLYGVDGNGDTVLEAADGGYDEVYSSGDYTLPTNVETLFLTGSARYGLGNSANNALIGNDLDNVLEAGEGAFESLVGGAGNDLLIGGAGHDQLLGGTGEDFFRFQNPTSDVFNGASNDGDFIFDFTASQGDKIQLNASAFGLSFGVVDGVNFFSGTSPAATEATPTLLYNTQSSTLFYDADGSGAGGLTILAGFGGSPDLKASDFILY
ncbi:malectin domain-containing carbohydrate-binding protein [Methylorubrum extorquens]